MSDFVPSRREDRRKWLSNISEKAVAQVTAAGGTEDQGTSLKTMADTLLEAYDGTDSAETALDGKRAIERNAEGTQIAAMRVLLTTLKVLPGWKSSGADAELQSSASNSKLDPSTYKPVFSLEIKGGLITFDFKKKGVAGLAFYGRLSGTTSWTKLGVDSSSPFIDDRPLAVPGVPEIREYMARGVINDVEIGLESDIMSITYGG